MGLYRAIKNLTFASLGKGVIVDELIELEDDYAKQVNEDLKLTFPDVAAVLVSVDTTAKEPEDKEPAKPKSKSKGKSDDK